MSLAEKNPYRLSYAGERSSVKFTQTVHTHHGHSKPSALSQKNSRVILVIVVHFIIDCDGCPPRRTVGFLIEGPGRSDHPFPG